MSRPDNENPRDNFEETTRALRKHRPRPSAALVARVERLAERHAARQPRHARPRFSRRRMAFALATALMIAVAGAVVIGEFRSSSRAAVPTTAARHEIAQNLNSAKLAKSASTAHFRALRLPATAQTYSQPLSAVPTSSALQGRVKNDYVNASDATSSGSATLESTPSSSGLVQIPTSKRLAELRVVLALKVKDRSQLSKATAKAMRIATSLGGHVVSANFDAPSSGVATSQLKLKVPAGRSQEALMRISVLGEILSQKVSLEDVQRTVTIESRSIATLTRRIAELERSLTDVSLTTEARAQLQAELASARARLSSLTVKRAKNVRRGRLATIELTLTTGNLAKPAAKPSRVHKALYRAWDGLSSEISWATMGLIVASPFILLAAVLAMLVRFRRRREEHRLLEK